MRNEWTAQLVCEGTPAKEAVHRAKAETAKDPIIRGPDLRKVVEELKNSGAVFGVWVAIWVAGPSPPSPSAPARASLLLYYMFMSTPSPPKRGQ